MATRVGELDKKLAEMPELPIKPDIVGYADHVNWAPYSEYSAKGHDDMYHDVYSDTSFSSKRLSYLGKNIDRVIRKVLINKKLPRKLRGHMDYVDIEPYEDFEPLRVRASYTDFPYSDVYNDYPYWQCGTDRD